MCFIGCTNRADNAPGWPVDVSGVCVLYLQCSVLSGTLHCCFFVFVVLLSLPWFIPFGIGKLFTLCLFYILRLVLFCCFFLLIFYISYHTRVCHLVVNCIYILLLDTLFAAVTTHMKNKSLLTLLYSLRHNYQNMTTKHHTVWTIPRSKYHKIGTPNTYIYILLVTFMYTLYYNVDALIGQFRKFIYIWLNKTDHWLSSVQ